MAAGNAITFYGPCTLWLAKSLSLPSWILIPMPWAFCVASFFSLPFVRQPGEDPGGRHIAGPMAMIQYDSVHFALALIKLGESPLGIAPRTEL